MLQKALPASLFQKSVSVCIWGGTSVYDVIIDNESKYIGKANCDVGQPIFMYIYIHFTNV